MDDLNQWVKDLYTHYREKVFGFFLRKLNSRENAEDLSSQTFLEVTRSASHFDDKISSESTWLYAICRNLLNKFLRDQYNHGKIAKIDINLNVEELPARDRDIEKIISAEELLDYLSHLTADKRNVIILSYYYGLEPREIAQKLGLSYTNVNAIKSRALKDLAEMRGI